MFARVLLSTTDFWKDVIARKKVPKRNYGGTSIMTTMESSNSNQIFF